MMHIDGTTHMSIVYILIAGFFALEIATEMLKKYKVTFTTKPLLPTVTPAILSLWLAFRLNGGELSGDATSIP